MRVKLRRKKVENLTAVEYRQCASATLRQNGQMAFTLHDSRAGDTVGVAYMLNHTATGELIGWALVNLRADPIHPLVHFYIKVKYRRMGYGSRLYAKIKKDYPKGQVEPWDERSTQFFRANGANC